MASCTSPAPIDRSSHGGADPLWPVIARSGEGAHCSKTPTILGAGSRRASRSPRLFRRVKALIAGSQASWSAAIIAAFSEPMRKAAMESPPPNDLGGIHAMNSFLDSRSSLHYRTGRPPAAGQQSAPGECRRIARREQSVGRTTRAAAVAQPCSAPEKGGWIYLHRGSRASAASSTAICWPRDQRAMRATKWLEIRSGMDWPWLVEKAKTILARRSM